MSDLTRADLEAIAAFDTPTICNALELIVPERRGHGFTTEHLVPLDADLPPMVGFARTVTIRAAEPSGETAEAMAEKRLAYYAYVAQQPMPAITVIQDLDPRPGIGAFWGEVQTNIHEGLGLLGCVTNGSFRDVTDSARGFQILGGKVGPSHAHVHVVDFGNQVTVHGLTVSHDDVVHADRHGAVMVPHDAVKKIPEICLMLQRREKVILDAAKAPGFDFDKLKAAIAGSKEIH
ncbi:MAG: RraA family protein [Pseudomonadota bacterium]